MLVTVWPRREGKKRQCQPLSFGTHTSSRQAEGEREDHEDRKLSNMQLSSLAESSRASRSSSYPSMPSTNQLALEEACLPSASQSGRESD